MSRRTERVGQIIKAELSELIRTELRDPRLGFATLTEAEVSADLRHVRVYVSVMGTTEEKNQTLDVLNSAAGFLRSQLGQKVRLRYTPEVAFTLDPSLERGSRVLALLAGRNPDGKSE